MNIVFKSKYLSFVKNYFMVDDRESSERLKLLYIFAQLILNVQARAGR